MKYDLTIPIQPSCTLQMSETITRYQYFTLVDHNKTKAEDLCGQMEVNHHAPNQNRHSNGTLNAIMNVFIHDSFKCNIPKNRIHIFFKINVHYKMSQNLMVLNHQQEHSWLNSPRHFFSKKSSSYQRFYSHFILNTMAKYSKDTCHFVKKFTGLYGSGVV